MMPVILRVLFVDDDHADVELARHALERDGIDIEWRCVDTERALRSALSEFEPHVVLCDYRIPGYCGIAALELVRSSYPLIPVVLFTGFIEESSAIGYLRKGAVDYVLKSNLRRLGTAVRRAIEDADIRVRTREAQQWHRQLGEVLEASLDLIVVSDLDGRITFVNEAACQLLGEPPVALIGCEWTDKICSHAPDAVRNEIFNFALQHGCWRGEVSMIRANGRKIATSQVVTAHRDGEGNPRCFSAIARDLSDIKSFQALIHKLAHYDTLTGLPNLAHLESVFSESAHSRLAPVLAIAIVKLDEFLLIEEGLGRLSSDLLLQQVGATLRAALDSDDVVARVGPHEFMILLNVARNRAAVGRVLSRLLASIAVRRDSRGRRVEFTASGGVALYPEDAENFQSLHDKANVAMHESVNKRPGHWRFYRDVLEKRAAHRFSLESGLRSAIQNSELTVAYQTQYDIRDGSSCGVEALARWRGADGEPVPPAVFVPLAEHLDLIAPLGACVLQKACATFAGWHWAEDSVAVVGVNVSTRQIGADLYGTVCDALQTSGLPARRLELEITESLFMKDGRRMLSQLERVRQLGVRIAVDDFGAGFSGLGYLSRLPVDRLKIDRSLIHGLVAGARNVDIVLAVIELGRRLGFTVLAEGVETEDELSLLCKLGCGQAQGFLLSKPARASVAERLMNTRWGDHATSSSHAIIGPGRLQTSPTSSVRQ